LHQKYEDGNEKREDERANILLDYVYVKLFQDI